MIISCHDWTSIWCFKTLDLADRNYCPLLDGMSQEHLDFTVAVTLMLSCFKGCRWSWWWQWCEWWWGRRWRKRKREKEEIILSPMTLGENALDLYSTLVSYKIYSYKLSYLNFTIIPWRWWYCKWKGFGKNVKAFAHRFRTSKGKS